MSLLKEVAKGRIHFANFNFIESIGFAPKSSRDREAIQEILDMDLILEIDLQGNVYHNKRIVANMKRTP